MLPPEGGIRASGPTEKIRLQYRAPMTHATPRAADAPSQNGWPHTSFASVCAEGIHRVDRMPYREIEKIQKALRSKRGLRSCRKGAF